MIFSIQGWEGTSMGRQCTLKGVPEVQTRLLVEVQSMRFCTVWPIVPSASKLEV